MRLGGRERPPSEGKASKQILPHYHIFPNSAENFNHESTDSDLESPQTGGKGAERHTGDAGWPFVGATHLATALRLAGLEVEPTFESAEKTSGKPPIAQQGQA